MSRVWSLGLVLLTCGVVGCGGALAGDPGTGGSGVAGTTGVGGIGGSGGSPIERSYTWGDVTVQIESLASSPTSLGLWATDDLTGETTEMMFPVATRLGPSNGAYARALYGCNGPVLQSVDVYSCADPGSATMAPGCLAASFRETGVTGDFILPDASHCVITAGSGSLGLPSPATPPPAQVATAIGGLTLDCASSAGARRHMTASFAIPVQSSFLLCSP